MNIALVPAFYAAVLVATLWLVFLWCARWQAGAPTRRVKALFGLAAVLLPFVPLGGLPLWGRAFSCYSNPSLPMLGIVGVALWQRLSGSAAFKPADWRAAWVFGATTGTVLYLHPLIFGASDLYYWGWERERAACGLAVIAVLLLGWGNRVGVLILAALIGYAVHALESRNCWDYIIDPIYWLISLGAVAHRLWTRAIRTWRGLVSAEERARRDPAVLPLLRQKQ